MGMQFNGRMHVCEPRELTIVSSALQAMQLKVKVVVQDSVGGPV